MKTFIPSLEHITLLKIVTTLWNQEDIINLLESFNNDCEMWREIEEKVIEKVPSLSYSRSLQQKILNVIKPIGDEILKYITFTKLESFKIIIGMLREISWTQQGTVARKKMAEAFLKNDNVDIAESYKLACIYCLKNDIETLWHKMPEVYKKYFYIEDSPYLVEHHSLVAFWTYYVTGQLDKLEHYWNPPYEHAFEMAVYYDNSIAAEYFFAELPPDKREQCLDTISTNVFFTSSRGYDIVHFLLSKMHEDQQLKMFETWALRIMQSFLYLPWQRLFIDLANKIFDFLKDDEFLSLLNSIARKISSGYKDYNYQEIFKALWIRSPMTFKKKTIHQCMTECFLLEVFKTRDESILTLILNDADELETEFIIMNTQSISICKCLAHSKEFNILKIFISKCISSREKAIKFKNFYKENTEIYYSTDSMEDNIRYNNVWKFFKFFNYQYLSPQEENDIEEKVFQLIEEIQ